MGLWVRKLELFRERCMGTLFMFFHLFCTYHVFPPFLHFSCFSTFFALIMFFHLFCTFHVFPPFLHFSCFSTFFALLMFFHLVFPPFLHFSCFSTFFAHIMFFHLFLQGYNLCDFLFDSLDGAAFLRSSAT